MFRILLILYLSVSLLFSCSKKNNVNKKGAVLVDGKVKEKGCKRFDLYCKRTGRVLTTSNLEGVPDATDQEIAMSIY